MRDLPDLLAGVYRHWKGHLYLVLGYAQDASESSGEMFVVYVGLQLDGTPSAMRMRCRRVSEFFETVSRPYPPEGERVAGMEYFRLVPRFEYVGPAAW